ncbi:MAG: hypothetical protein WCH05_08375, partial [Chlorobiaceae bacterium]
FKGFNQFNQLSYFWGVFQGLPHAPRSAVPRAIARSVFFVFIEGPLLVFFVLVMCRFSLSAFEKSIIVPKRVCELFSQALGRVQRLAVTGLHGDAGKFFSHISALPRNVRETHYWAYYETSIKFFCSFVRQYHKL